MEDNVFQVDPIKEGFEFNKPDNPTKTGWKIVSPEMWYFRNNEMADKAMTVKGYADPDYYMDCTKAKIVCDVYNENPSATPGDLHAEIFKRYLERQNIDIRNREILIGNWGNDPHGIPFDPRADLWFSFQEFCEYKKAYFWENGEKKLVTDELYKEVEVFSNKMNIVFSMKPYMSEKDYQMYIMGAWRYWELPGTSGYRATPDHKWYMKKGIRNIIHDMEKTIERLEMEQDEATGSHYVELAHRINDCRSAVKAGEYFIAWIKRHGKEAKALAAKESDPKERERLSELSNICEWIAENPPRTFWEMMQFHWFCFLCFYLIEHPSHSTPIRPDWMWWDWYEKDVLIDKTLSRQKAGDLVAMYFMKYHEIGLLGSLANARQIGMGSRDFTVLTIAGQKADGSDATNDLTLLILDVIDGYRFHFPDVKVRWHSKFDNNNLKRVVEVMRTGMGCPSLKNDNVAIPGMMSQYEGLVSLKEARSWAVVGCNTPGVTINSKGPQRRAGRTINTLKTMEFTLFNGKDPEPGYEYISTIETGDPSTFKDFEEFYQAWYKQWVWFVKKGINLRNTVDEYYQKVVRRPFMTLLYEKSVREGMDIMHSDSPWLSFNNCPGWVDLIDSLAAIKFWIYDKKKYTMQQLVGAIKDNWEGHKEMQSDFKDAPKFGNNDDYVDSLFSRATTEVTDAGKKMLDLQNQPAGLMSALVVTLMYHLAAFNGAMPNGRKRGEPLCDGGINPHAEFDKGGPWDRVASAMKIDQAQFKAWIYNQKFDYNSVKGDAGLQKMVDYTLAGMEGGMDQMQYNLVSKDILLDAKKNPEKHPFLAVRISGYSAYFSDLPEFVQDAVIDRIDHEL